MILCIRVHTPEQMLKQIKDITMPEVDDKSVFTYHSFRVLFAAQLGCAKRAGPEMQVMCMWQLQASLAIYVRVYAHASQGSHQDAR